MRDVLLMLGSQLIALIILQVAQLRRHRQGNKAALKVLHHMNDATSVTVNADGGFEVRRTDEPKQGLARPPRGGGSHQNE
jgi:hypothetical protein